MLNFFSDKVFWNWVSELLNIFCKQILQHIWFPACIWMETNVMCLKFLIFLTKYLKQFFFLSSLDPEQKEMLIEVIEKLLKDRSTVRDELLFHIYVYAVCVYVCV